MNARAIHQASEGHIVRAAHLEHKAHEQRVDAMIDSRHPVAMATAVRPPPVSKVVVAAEVAAITHPRPPTAAVVATDIAIKEAEMKALAAHRMMTQPPPMRPPMGMYPSPYGYPPGPACYPASPPAGYGYPPPPPMAAGYPPSPGYPPTDPYAYPPR